MQLVHQVLLFVGIGRQGEKQDGCLQCITPLGLVGQNGWRTVNGVKVLSQFEGVLFVPVAVSDQRVEANLVVLHVFLQQVLARDLARYNGGTNVILPEESQSNLFKNEFDLLLLGEGTVGFDVNFLHNLRSTINVASFFLDGSQRTSQSSSFGFEKEFSIRHVSQFLHQLVATRTCKSFCFDQDISFQQYPRCCQMHHTANGS
mmetsp:Transcript_29677/g.48971  ORF Transcript_29677/g.48971 Transcript_29677/m.48971 type:complete len:203 (+) Transcript_29677:584-1192(+)